MNLEIFKTLPEYLKSNICISDDTTCWPWVGYSKGGYGYSQAKLREHNTCLAHRRVYQLLNNKILPRDTVIMHTCDNPICCNPNHLREATQFDNIRDRTIKNRSHRPIGITNKNSKLTDQAVVNIRADTRRLADIQKEYGIGESALLSILKGDTWKHIPLGPNINRRALRKQEKEKNT